MRNKGQALIDFLLGFSLFLPIAFLSARLIWVQYLRTNCEFRLFETTRRVLANPNYLSWRSRIDIQEDHVNGQRFCKGRLSKVTLYHTEETGLVVDEEK